MPHVWATDDQAILCNLKYQCERNVQQMKSENVQQMKPDPKSRPHDPKSLGPQINSLMLTVLNRTASDIVSAIQKQILDFTELPVDLTPEQAYRRGLQVARDIAKSKIKDSVTLK